MFMKVKYECYSFFNQRGNRLLQTKKEDVFNIFSFLSFFYLTLRILHFGDGKLNECLLLNPCIYSSILEE